MPKGNSGRKKNDFSSMILKKLSNLDEDKGEVLELDGDFLRKHDADGRFEISKDSKYADVLKQINDMKVPENIGDTGGGLNYIKDFVNKVTSGMSLETVNGLGIEMARNASYYRKPLLLKDFSNSKNQSESLHKISFEIYSRMAKGEMPVLKRYSLGQHTENFYKVIDNYLKHNPKGKIYVSS